MKPPLALAIAVDDESLIATLSDCRTITAPLVWFPRLKNGTSDERSNWRIIGNGTGFHWPALDEDISVENLLLGKASAESQASLNRWLQQRAQS
jgi:hypothetical protein